MDTTLRAYLECALWTSTDENEEPLDGLYSVDDIADVSVRAAEHDVTDFTSSNAEDLDGLDDAQIGHDFWLTRNRHGAGFWDRGLGARGDRLTADAHPYGESYAYVGDDGLVYID